MDGIFLPVPSTAIILCPLNSIAAVLDIQWFAHSRVGSNSTRDTSLSKKRKKKLQETLKVKNTTHGQGLFAKKAFAKNSVVGRIKGKVVSDESHDPRYVMELENDLLLVPKAPFRFLNHSCRPNCELFDWEDEPPNPKTGVKDLYLGVVRKIAAGDELTIDYSWPAGFAIPCHCGSKKCRGHIVAKEELHLVAEA